MPKDNENDYRGTEGMNHDSPSQSAQEPWDNKFEEDNLKERQFSRSVRNQPAKEARNLSKVLLLIIIVGFITPFLLYIIVNGGKKNDQIATRPATEVRIDRNSTTKEETKETTANEITLATREVTNETIESTTAQSRTTQAPPAEPTPAPQTPSQGSGTYTVQAGDSWFAIARNYGIDVYQLAQFNGASIDSPLFPGDTVQIP